MLEEQLSTNSTSGASGISVQLTSSVEAKVVAGTGAVVSCTVIT
tara:strand:- start:526 stop:657 length:132 start_codon:yes stop_codon:yes gene_type:complete